jgi:hypothetical protein
MKASAGGAGAKASLRLLKENRRKLTVKIKRNNREESNGESYRRNISQYGSRK